MILVCFTRINIDTKYWYDDIYQYLKYQTIPDKYEINDRIQLKRIVVKYMMSGEVLYRSSFDGTLLRCLTHHETSIAVEQVHDGLFGGHFHANALHTKLL